jgi:hypothetical protein
MVDGRGDAVGIHGVSWRLLHGEVLVEDLRCFRFHVFVVRSNGDGR